MERETEVLRQILPNSQKKQTYAEYRQARQEMKDLQTAKYNVDQFLKKEEEDRQAEKSKKQEKVL